MDPVRTSRALAREVDRLSFGPPVTHVYHPLDYAKEVHEEYLRRWAKPGKEVLFVGMNPGPWGMCQTGVPFGEVAAVRDWMGLEGRVDRPRDEHPKKRVEGFACGRSEVSGQRFWGWARERFGTPERFFRRFFVWNYCPLCFVTESGRNRTPNELPARERATLFEACDRALARIVRHLRPRLVVGVGAFAEERAREALGPEGPEVGRVLHPSPASPLANRREWATQAEAQLRALGVELPPRHRRGGRVSR